MRAVLGIPLTLASVVLAGLALFAGKTPGFMEDYHIILLNTSDLGQHLIPTPTIGASPSPTSCGSLGGLLGKLCASATAAASDAVSSGVADLSNVEGDIADELARKLGIREWYSLHVMDVCEGMFTPNATTLNAGYNVTSCTGHFSVYLADLGFTQDIQTELNKIPGLLLMLAIWYILGVALAALCLCLSVARLMLGSHGVLICLLNLILTVAATISLLVGNVITTTTAKLLANKINQLGQHIGISASPGRKFVVITWVAFALKVVITISWICEVRQALVARHATLRQQRWNGRF